MIRSRRSVLKICTVLTAAAGLAVAGCTQPGGSTTQPGGSQQITITHSQGTTELDRTPERIVVFDLGALDTLRAVGLGDKVIGIPKSAPLPEEFAEFRSDRIPSVGTLAEPNYEEVNKLKPDLVIVGFRSAKAYPEMSKYFKTIDVTYKQDKPFYDGVAYASKIIGEATGTTAKVDAKLKELKASIDAARPKAASAGNAMVVMTSAGKVTAHGAASRYGLIFQDLGIAPAQEKVNTAAHGDPVSFEAIQQINPQFLFVVDRDAAIGQSGAAAKQVIDNEITRTTSAFQNNHVVYLTSTRWYITIHGLDNAKAMVDEVAAAL